MTQLNDLEINNNSISDDIITKTIGNFGRWQLRTVILVFLCKIPTVWFTAAIIYTAPTPKSNELHCELLLNNNNNLTFKNNNTKTSIQLIHPLNDDIQRNTDREFNISFCNIYTNNTNYKYNNGEFIIQNYNNNKNNNSNIISCNNSNIKIDFHSIITDFKLFCSRQLLISVTQCFHALGTLLGGLISIVLLNYISPRTLMLYGMIFQIIYGNMTGFMHRYELHLFFRCVTSLSCAVMFSAGQTIFSDITGGRAKTIATTLSELFWSIGLIILPGISIFVDSWTYLYVAISSPTIILVFLHRWISESPRWLIKHGKIDKALEVLLESTAFNGRHIPLDIEERLKAYAEYQSKISSTSKYSSIWDGKTKKRYIISVHWAWVFAVMLYSAMILNIRSFGVDHIHVNTVILGFAEMLGVFIGLFFIFYTRKRWFWSGCFKLIAGLITLFIWLVPNTIKESHRVGLDMIFCIILKMANAASLAILVTCTGEMVGTRKRQMLMLSVTTWSRIWLLVAPFITATSMIHPLIPITAFAILAVINGIFMCFLNKQFRNWNQPKIERVPTLNTFRRNSALLLLKRNSTCSELTTTTDEPATLKASISDIWTVSSDKNNIPNKIDEEENV